MSEVKFKVGDLVYCPAINNKISKITKESEEIYIFLSNAGWFKNTGLNQNDMPVIFHTTQENYELLSKLYPNVAFEPPKRKEPKEIIKAMFESGWVGVGCYVNDIDKRPSKYNKKVLITSIDEVGEHIFKDDTYGWKYANPFDPKTGKTIINFVNGEVILESENDIS